MNLALNEDLKMKIKLFYRDYLWNYAPGTYDTLNRICTRSTGKGFVELLFDNPSQLKKILRSKYPEEFSLRFFVKNIIVRPLLVKLQRLELLDWLTDLFIKDDYRFREEILKLLKSFNN